MAAVPSNVETFTRPTVNDFIKLRSGESATTDRSTWIPLPGLPHQDAQPADGLIVPMGESAVRVGRTRELWETPNDLQLPYGVITAYRRTLCRPDDDVDPTGPLEPWFDSSKEPSTPTSYYIDTDYKVKKGTPAVTTVFNSGSTSPATSIPGPWSGRYVMLTPADNYVRHPKPTHVPGFTNPT